MGQLELNIVATLSRLDMTTLAYLDNYNSARMSIEWSPRSDEEVEDLSTMKPHSGPGHHTDHVLRHLLTT